MLTVTKHVSCFLLAAALLCAPSAFAAKSNANFPVQAQQQRVTGVVEDDMGPIAGASILVKGTSKIAITDVAGKFALDGVKSGDILVASFMGYVTQEIPWMGQAILNIKLVPSAEQLEEVMVVAYGTTKKSTFTGSASVVKADKLEKVMGTGFAESLQGMSAGVNVVNVQGNPGGNTRIEIRGIASMSGSATPLFIVDGMPYDGDWNQINPADIESMTVLKDASATSLYGSRAANGVVVINTKKGKSSRPTVTARMAWGTSDTAVPFPTKSNPYQQIENTWYALYYDAYYFNGMDMQAAGDYASDNALTRQVKAMTNSAGQSIYVTPFKYINENYVLHDGKGNPYMNPKLEYVWEPDDWDVYKAVYSRKLRQDYSFDVSGSTDNGKTQYFFSGGYLDDLGYGNTQYYKRYSFRANVNTNIRDWWRMGGSLAYSRHRQNLSGGSSRACNFTTTLSSPWLRNIDNTDWVVSEKTGQRMYDFGKYTNNFFGIQVLNNSGDYWNNPNDDSFDSNMGHILTSNFYSEFTLPANLVFKTALNIDDYWYRSMNYGSAVHSSGQTAPYGTSILADGGYASRYDYNKLSVTWNNVLSGNWNFGKSNISGLVGQEFYTWNAGYEQGWGEGIMELGKYELSNTTKNFGVYGGRDEYALLSFFGKLDYNYNEKYYLSGSVREDGSSRFNAENRWGTFWSAGASWRISKEDFMEDITWIDNLQLRGSFGTTGNDKLIVRQGNGKAGGEVLYGYQGTYTRDDLYLSPGLKPATYSTPDLKWESNEQWNIGLDFSLWNRINGTIEYYSRTSRDLLYYKEVPLSAQVGDATGYNMNIGDLRNSGLEFTINANVIATPNFRWDIDANLSTLKNEVTYLPTGSYTYAGTACTYIMEEGGSLYDFIAPQYDGLDPQTGMPGWLKKVKDANGKWNGEWVRTETRSQLTTDDYVKCGSSIPSLFGSITNNLRWGGFDFSMMWYYSYGSKMSDYTYKERITNRAGVGMSWDLIQNRWKQPGDNGEDMQARWSYSQYGNTAQYSTFFVFDNHYWRLRNLTIGYTLPKKILSNWGVSNLRVYLTGNNLLTFGPAAKRYSDPETGVLGNSYNGNVDTDNGIQGSRRMYMGGIQISF